MAKVALRNSGYVAAPGDDPRAPSMAQHRAMLDAQTEPASGLGSGPKNPLGNPHVRIMTAARKELARVAKLARIDMPADVVPELLEAIGLTDPPKKTR